MKLDDIIRRIGDFSRDAVLITEAEPFDLPGPRILWVNKAFTEMMGYAPEEVIGQSPRMLQREDFDPEAGRNIRHALDAWEPVRQVVRNHTKDGRPVWVELDITPIADESGWVHYWLAIQRDVTERIETERRLAEAERRFEIAASVSLIGVWDWDVRSGALYWSDEFCAMVGITREQFTGDFDAFASRLHPDDLARVEAALAAHLEADKTYDIEYRLKHSDGHFIDVKARGAVQRDADGQPIHMIGSVQDVTRERSRERALAEAKQAAEAANVAKSQFLANMSHEIRTPLNGVLGLSTLLARTDLSDKQAKYLEAIESSGQALRALVDDLLDISRIEAGQLDLRAAPFDPSNAINGAMDAVRAKAEAKALSLHLTNHLPPDTELIGDAARLTQIVLNLVSNAVKFTERGAVDVDADLDASGALRIAVRDTGIGIPPGALGQIFERFSQVDSSSTRAHDGAGLGLAISRELARAMGGDITATSAVGEGSVFTFTAPMPVAPRAVAAAPNIARESEADAAAPRSVLIVEDNAVNREVLRDLLEQADIKVDLAQDGVEALEKLATDPAIGLVLLDLQMPRLSGEGVLAQMRRDSERLRAMPVLVVTANATKDTADRVRRLGADGFVTKPFKLDAILSDVRRLLTDGRRSVAA